MCTYKIYFISGNSLILYNATKTKISDEIYLFVDGEYREYEVPIKNVCYIEKFQK